MRSLCLIVLATLLPACATTSALPPAPAKINHVVFFELKDPGDRAELIDDCNAMAAAVPGIVSRYAGEHVDAGRDTVKSDYDVGFYVGFDTLDAYRVYVGHDAHVALVTKWRPRLDGLTVYDVQGR